MTIHVISTPKVVVDHWNWLVGSVARYSVAVSVPASSFMIRGSTVGEGESV